MTQTDYSGQDGTATSDRAVGSPVDEGLRAKQPVRIAGMFDAIAHRYDLLNRLLSGGLDQRWRARAVAALRLKPTDVLVDVCTGTADVALSALSS